MQFHSIIMFNTHLKPPLPINLKTLIFLSSSSSLFSPHPFKFFHQFTPFKLKPSIIFLQSLKTLQLPMSSKAQNKSDSTSMEQTHLPENPNSLPISLYPIPLSPPLPQISKEIELDRALTASSRSNLFSLSKDDVVFEDEWLLIVNKPSGIYCDSVLSSASGFVKQSIDSSALLEVHLANRLDRDTSGIMVITKSHKVASKLVKAFTNHQIQKTYIARCIGSIPKWDKVKLVSGHGRSKFGVWRVYAASDVGRALPGGSVVRDMETRYEVLLVNGQVHSNTSLQTTKDEEETLVIEEKSSVDTNQMRDEILVRASPKSGRTHQIRLHCQYLGIPIRGDVKYGGVYEWEGESCDGHELHAESLSFEHPITCLPLLVQAPLPLWASQVINQTKQNQ